jgi:tRNA-specific 2-thiouridylase
MSGSPDRSAGPTLLAQVEGLEGHPASSGPVVTAISGGVDSAVAARLLLSHGYDILGVHFLLSAGERGARARQAAITVADSLGIPLRLIDLTEPFLEKVVRPFCDDYRNGRTPSPCVMCNPLVKFSTLFSVAADVGASLVATGHYARRITEGGVTTLRRGRDPAKDQSYFLYRLPSPWLARTVFPLGRMLKPDVVRAAKEWGIPIAGGESRDICFIDGEDYRSTLGDGAGGLGVTGRIIDAAGGILGGHGGIAAFTVGQRKGLGLAGGPWYVLSIDSATGDVVVGKGEIRCVGGLLMTRAAWVAGAPPADEFRAEVAVRYRQRPIPSAIRRGEGEFWEIRFDLAAAGVAPGQSAVLYDGDRVVGGGVIEAPIP